MIAIVTLLLVLALSMIVTRIASVALVHTGLGREAARFQARSALTGVGFTTSESEGIVGHPVRRRIVSSLMLFGSVGFVTATSTVLLSFVDIGSGMGMSMGIAGGHSDAPDPETARRALRNLGLLIGGIASLWWLSTSAWVDRHLCRWISWGLNRWSDVDARDYARLLHLREDYGVTELRLGSDDWLVGQTVGDARLGDEGVIVLGVECPGSNFIGAPPAGTELRDGDLLILYGRTPRIAEIDARLRGSPGEQAHHEAVGEQGRIGEEECARAGR